MQMHKYQALQTVLHKLKLVWVSLVLTKICCYVPAEAAWLDVALQHSEIQSWGLTAP